MEIYDTYEKIFETKQENIDIEKTQEILAGAINSFIELINQFPEEYREITLIGEWSLKDSLAHFSGWNQLTIDDIARTLRDEDSVWVDGDDEMNQFNADNVNERRFLSWEKVFGEFIEISQNLVFAYKGIPSNDWNKSMRLNEFFPLFWSLLIDIKHYRIDHLPEIQAKLVELLNQEQ
ncbi:MAG: hypothetical protein ABI721_01550 [Candidatus Dojkabacteria bacterium]